MEEVKDLSKFRKIDKSVVRNQKQYQKKYFDSQNFELP